MGFLNEWLAKWNVKHLVAAWGVYWLGLVAWAGTVLGPAIWHLSRPGVKGSGSGGFTDGVFNVTMTEGTTTFWTGSISVQTLAFLIAVPPLLLWAWWLAAQKRPPRRASEQLDAGSALGDLANRGDERVELRRPDE